MRAVCVSIAVALCVAIAPVCAQAAIRHYEINIRRQPLETALQDFAHQTGLQIARFSDTIDGRALVGPLEGDYSAEQALDKLLAQHGLTYRLVNDRTVAVMESAAPRTDATNGRSSNGDKFAAPARTEPMPTAGAGWLRHLTLAQAEPMRLAMLGAISEHKGVGCVIGAVSAFRQLGLDVEVTVIGPPERRT